MLVLTRKRCESIRIDRQIEITVLEVRGNRVRLGIDAPPHVRIARSEVWVEKNDSLPQSGASSHYLPMSIGPATVASESLH